MGVGGINHPINMGSGEIRSSQQTTPNHLFISNALTGTTGKHNASCDYSRSISKNPDWNGSKSMSKVTYQVQDPLRDKSGLRRSVWNIKAMDLCPIMV